MTEPTNCPTCGNPTTTTEDGVELGRITIVRVLTDDQPEVWTTGSEGLMWYDAMAMVHIAADTIAQGGLNDDEDDDL